MAEEIEIKVDKTLLVTYQAKSIGIRIETSGDDVSDVNYAILDTNGNVILTLSKTRFQDLLKIISRITGATIIINRKEDKEE